MLKYGKTLKNIVKYGNSLKINKLFLVDKQGLSTSRFLGMLRCGKPCVEKYKNEVKLFENS